MSRLRGSAPSRAAQGGLGLYILKTTEMLAGKGCKLDCNLCPAASTGVWGQGPQGIFLLLDGAVDRFSMQKWV